MPQLKPLPKFILIAAVIGGLFYGVNYLATKGFLGSSAEKMSSVPERIDLPGSAPGLGAERVALPSNSASPEPAANFTATVMTLPWNATMGLHYANGNVVTEPGSLMAKRGIKVKIERQDDYAQMISALAAFGKGVSKGGAAPDTGAAFVIIMGDGYPAFYAGAQQALSKLGLNAQAVAAFGYSRGEDKCMMPADVKTDPQKARGALIGAVLRDGDWNICVKWASDNAIPINPDEKTFDPSALNFVSVTSFTEADEKLIAGYCEDRPVVNNGKRTGEKRRVCQNGTATWTPGDVKIAKQKGGIVSIASTKEYVWQMPAIVIGVKEWMEKNPVWTEQFIAAALEGGETVRTNDAALLKAAGISAKVYKEETAEYWAKYYKGVTERDKLGLDIHLGGSAAIGLGDNAFLFGLNGNDNLYKRVYTVFGNIAKTYYPEVMPKVLPYESAVTTRYLESLLAKAGKTSQASQPSYSDAQTTGAFAKRAWSIEFEPGQANFTAQTTATLEDLLNQISVSGLPVQINGHTDNIGNSQGNLQLAKRRAEAVKQWIEANAPSTFPQDRIRTRAYGDAQPIASNASAEGRAKNRRVEIILLNTR